MGGISLGQDNSYCLLAGNGSFGRLLGQGQETDKHVGIGEQRATCSPWPLPSLPRIA